MSRRALAEREGDAMAANAHAQFDALRGATLGRRQPRDFYPTPPEALCALLDQEGEALRDFARVWEPAAGDGRLVDGLRRRLEWAEVLASDIEPRAPSDAVARDFYAFNHALAPAIITNPPFVECDGRGGRRWVQHAAEIGVAYMALLLPAAWAHAVARRAVFEVWRPAREYPIGWRIDWTGGGASPASHSWFVWDRRAPAAAGILKKGKL